MRLLLAIFAALPLTPSILLCQKPEPSKALYSKEEIRQVLILARDAVLQEQSDGDSGWLGRHQEAIMLAFKSINDWQDASVLQKKTGTLYAPPHPTLADYKALQDALRNLDEYAREPSLSVVVGESASDGFSGQSIYPLLEHREKWGTPFPQIGFSGVLPSASALRRLTNERWQSGKEPSPSVEP